MIIFKTFSDIKKIQTKENRNAAEAIALTIGQLGENINVRRAQIIFTHPFIQLHGHCHPKS